MTLEPPRGVPACMAAVVIWSLYAAIAGPPRGRAEGSAVGEEELRLSTSDGLSLEARLARPAEWTPAAGLAVLCHPHPLQGGTMDDAVTGAVGRRLNGEGVAALRFNFRGTGGSEGEHSGGMKEPLDVLAAAAYARDRLAVEPGRMAVVGYSFGAGMAAGALAKLPVDVAYVGIPLPAQLQKPFEDWSGLMQADRSVMFVAGGADEIAPPSALIQYLVTRPGGARIELIGQASHFFSSPGQLAAVADAVATFLRELWTRAE